MSKVSRKSMNAPVMVTVTPRNTVRSSVGGGGFTSSRRNVVSSSMSFHPTGATAQASKDAVQSVLQGRSQEKKEISALNVKFADYLQSVKYLEAQIKCLMDENEKLRKMKGYCGDRLKEQFEDELRDAREALDTVKKQLSPLQASEVTLKDKIESLEEELERLKRQLDEKIGQIGKLNQMVSDMEGECCTLRLQCEGLGKDNEYLKAELLAKRNDNDRLRADFEEAVRKQIDAECERDAIAEELDFVNETSMMEINELRELLKNLKSCMPVVKEDFQASFKSAVQAMQHDYDERLQTMSAEMQRRYDDQLSSIQANVKRDTPDMAVRSETKTLKSSLDANRKTIAELERANAGLKSEIDALRAQLDQECDDCEAQKNELRETISQLNCENSEIMNDLQTMRSNNLDLHVEINCYRKLLEGEEQSMKKIVEHSQQMQSSGGASLANIISGGGGSSMSMSSSSGGGGSMSQQSTMSESTGTVRVTRSSKCVVTIAEVAQDGSCIRLENGSNTKDFDLSNFVLERKHKNDKKTSSFTFPKDFKLRSGQSVTIYSKAFEDQVKGNDKVADCTTWGVGNGEVLLRDLDKNEKAKCSIKYS